MSRETLLAAAAGVVTGLFLVPVLTTQPAAAAQLHVTAAPLQTWKIAHGLPELPTTPVEEVVDPEAADEAPDASETDSEGKPGASNDGGHEADGDGQPSQPTEPGTPPDDSPSEDPPAEEPTDEAAPADQAPAPAQQGERVSEVTQDVTAP